MAGLEAASESCFTPAIPNYGTAAIGASRLPEWPDNPHDRLVQAIYYTRGLGDVGVGDLGAGDIHQLLQRLNSVSETIIDMDPARFTTALESAPQFSRDRPPRVRAGLRTFSPLLRAMNSDRRGGTWTPCAGGTWLRWKIIETSSDGDLFRWKYQVSEPTIEELHQMLSDDLREARILVEMQHWPSQPRP